MLKVLFSQLTAVDFAEGVAIQIRNLVMVNISIHAQNSFGKSFDQPQIMTDHHDRHLLRQRSQGLKKLLLHAQIDVGGWFIEQEQPRFRDQSPGNQNPLFLAS